MNGGIGFSINEPRGVLDFSVSDEFSFIDKRECIWEDNEHDQLLNTLVETQKLLKLEKRISVKLSGDLLSHFGMGSGTAIRLACLEALLRLNDKKIVPDDLVRLSKRGGTSGIGIHTYFSGQFVFDLGVKNRGVSFEPSSNHERPQHPLLLDSLDFPEWEIGLCIPMSIRPKSRAEEIEFFEKTCPINSQESYKAVFHSLFGAYASVREHDMESFAKSIREIQHCEWKQCERHEYASELFEIESKLYDLGAKCVGLSSLGPLLFFLAPVGKYGTIQEKMENTNSRIIVTTASNSGREIVI